MRVDIVAATDKGYEQHTAVMLASLFSNNPGKEFVIHLLHSDKSVDIPKLLKLIKRCKQDYRTYEIKEESLSGFKLSHHVTLATYFRLLIPDLLPKEIDKILYLDSDLVVLGDITELWNTDISTWALAGRTDKFDRHEELGITTGHQYFNAGVMLWNLKMIRQSNFLANAREYLSKKFDQIQFWDQDIINYLLQGKIKEFSKIWNTFSAEHEGDKSNIKICHYIGSVKPWVYPQSNGLDMFYFKYLLKTPWYYKCFVNSRYFTRILFHN